MLFIRNVHGLALEDAGERECWVKCVGAGGRVEEEVDRWGIWFYLTSRGQQGARFP